MKFENLNILIISPQPWGMHFISKHHYAKELSHKNKVYFLNPPSHSNVVTRVSDNLFVIDYRPALKGANRLPRMVRNIIDRITIGKLLKQPLVEHPEIVWSFDPYRFLDLTLFKPRYSIFHSADVHHTKTDLVIAASADLVLAPSKLILKKYDNVSKRKHLINHGIAEHFIHLNSKTSDIEVISDRINVGLVGNLHFPYMDTNSLLGIIKENQNAVFHFIGPTSNSNLGSSQRNGELLKIIEELPNCFLHGSRPSLELPGILNKMDMFLICYDADQYQTELSNSHKILEYLSTGKSIVCHYVDEYSNQDGLIEMADRNELLPSKFREVLNNLESFNRNELVEKRKNYAAQHTYRKQIHRIEQLIQ